jgi:steroid delta-isomerase-like uncharacterized protein
MRSVALVVAILVVGQCAFYGAHVSVVSAQSATPTTCPTTTEEENAAIARRWHEDVINGANLDALDEITTDDIVHHAGTFPDGVGRDTVKGVLGALLTGFPDVHHTVDQVITQDDFVVIRWTAHGTHTGPFQGHAPTGKPVTWTGINIFRIACGRIAEEWSEVDGLGRLQQIGLPATPTP